MPCVIAYIHDCNLFAPPIKYSRSTVREREKAVDVYPLVACLVSYFECSKDRLELPTIDTLPQGWWRR